MATTGTSFHGRSEPAPSVGGSGAKEAFASAVARFRPRVAVASASTSPPCSSDAQNVETAFPRRSVRTSMGEVLRVPWARLEPWPDGFGVLTGMIDQFYHDHLARLGAALRTGRDENILADTLVFRDDKINTVFDEQAPDHALVHMLQNFNHRARGSAAPIDADDTHHHLVAMQHLAHFLGIEEQIVAAAFADDEAIGVGMTLYRAFDQIELVGNANRLFAIAHDLAIALHGL